MSQVWQQCAPARKPQQRIAPAKPGLTPKVRKVVTLSNAWSYLLNSSRFAS